MDNQIPEGPYRILARERSHEDARQTVATNRMLVQSLGTGDTGGSGQCPTGRTFCVQADAQTPLLKGCRDGEVFFKLFSTPECHALRDYTAFGS